MLQVTAVTEFAILYIFFPSSFRLSFFKVMYVVKTYFLTNNKIMGLNKSDFRLLVLIITLIHYYEI